MRAIATRRQAGHWASPAVAGAPEAPRKALHAVYDALVAAADFFALRNLHKGRLRLPRRRRDVPGLRVGTLTASTSCTATSARPPTRPRRPGWDILKPLRADLEARYVNWYLTKLALAWGKFIEPQGRAADQVADRRGSQPARFYDRNVRPWLDEADNRRAFVIISDAFRYEAAQELAAELNGKYRFEATLSSQLGVLPSYTALGMASLLPHKTLAYKPERRRAGRRQAELASRAAGRDPARPSAGWPARRAT